ncbi:MAG: hypothetical protein JNL01_13270 [Bdellovibrionales bacterium]|nr:hypothetical protein [Bdellovibrionales bacterium]
MVILALMLSITASWIGWENPSQAAPKGISLIPSREIDTPYTIPEGTWAWHGALVGDRIDHRPELQSTANDGFRVIPFPLVWEVAANDTITWTFGFIGVGVRAQLAKNKNLRAGIRTFIQNNSPADIDLAKYFHESAFDGRFFFTRDLGLEFSFSVNGALSFDDIRSSSGTYLGQMGGSVGPMFQFTDNWALSVWAGYHRTSGFLATQYITGSIFVPTDFGLTPSQRIWEWVGSYGLNSWFYLNPNWGWKTSYQIAGIGTSRLVRVQTLTLDLTYHW